MNEREEVERLQRLLDDLEQDIANVLRELSIHCDSRMEHGLGCEGALWECSKCGKFNCALVGSDGMDEPYNSWCDKCWYAAYKRGEIE